MFVLAIVSFEAYCHRAMTVSPQSVIKLNHSCRIAVNSAPALFEEPHRHHKREQYSSRGSDISEAVAHTAVTSANTKSRRAVSMSDVDDARNRDARLEVMLGVIHDIWRRHDARAMQFGILAMRRRGEVPARRPAQWGYR